MRKTYKIDQLLLMLLVIVFFNMSMMFNNVYAQPGVKLKIDPDERSIFIGSGEITMIAEPDKSFKPGLQFKWTLEGPGMFVGNTASPGLFYAPPDTIDGKLARATVTVTVRDDQGKEATDSVTFTLVVPESTPVSESTPSPLALTSLPVEVYIQGIGEPDQPMNSQIVSIKVGEYLSKSKSVQIYPNHQSQVKFELQLLPASLPKLIPLAFKTLPVEKFKKLQQRLPKYFEIYKELSEKEQQGANIDNQIIPILTNISKDMQEVENIYKQLYQGFYEPLSQDISEMVQKIVRIKDARENFENELSYRQRQQSSGK